MKYVKPLEAHLDSLEGYLACRTGMQNVVAFQKHSPTLKTLRL